MKTPSKKILIVDDEPNILMSLDFLFRKKGFDVFIARNGSEAIQILNSEIPDLVLLDIMMPDVDGYEVCVYIKEKETLKATKVIFLSAKSKKTDIEKGIAMGADLYLTKPFSTRELTSEVERLLTHA
ncbi:MAG: response regulator [Schleiferiaceae bacterium]|nr:response regulator [Schleiferiaceae bacterium]